MTGEWRPGVPSVRGGAVNALAVSGTTLFVGGEFNKLGEKSVSRLGAVDLATGQVLDWAPSLGCNVNAMEVVGGRLYVAACDLRVYDASTLLPVSAPATTGGPVYAIEPDGLGGVWIGGLFTKFAGANTPYLGHVDFNGLAVGYPMVDRRVVRDRGVRAGAVPVRRVRAARG